MLQVDVAVHVVHVYVHMNSPLTKQRNQMLGRGEGIGCNCYSPES